MNSHKMGTVLRLVGIGWYIGMCIGGGAYGGLLMDRWLDLSPVFTLLGLGAGLFVAIVGMFRMLLAVLRAPSESIDPRDA